MGRNEFLLQCIDLFRDYTPHSGPPLELPFLTVGETTVDVHIFREDSQTWILLFDARQQAQQTQDERQFLYNQSIRNARSNTLVARYLGGLAQIVKPDGLGVREHADQRFLAILFSDLEGFTQYTNNRSAQEVFATLNVYIGAMIESVHSHHGIVDKVIGDSVMAVFGMTQPNPAYDAIAAAHEMLQENETINREHEAQFKVRIGIASGSAMVGSVGSNLRRELSVFGAPVNLASRLQHAAVPGQAVCDIETSRALGSISARTEVITLKGYPKPVKIFRIC